MSAESGESRPRGKRKSVKPVVWDLWMVLTTLRVSLWFVQLLFQFSTTGFKSDEKRFGPDHGRLRHEDR
jgi:hypothetical protein